MTDPKSNDDHPNRQNAASPDELWRMRRRKILGGISAVMLGGAAVIHFLRPADVAAKAVLLRVGIVLGATWLALPELERIPKWMFAGLLGGVLIVVAKPQTIVAVVPALLIMWSLRGVAKVFE